MMIEKISNYIIEDEIEYNEENVNRDNQEYRKGYENGYQNGIFIGIILGVLSTFSFHLAILNIKK